jgi:hypothetical protein
MENLKSGDLLMNDVKQLLWLPEEILPNASPTMNNNNNRLSVNYQILYLTKTNLLLMIQKGF